MRKLSTPGCHSTGYVFLLTVRLTCWFVSVTES